MLKTEAKAWFFTDPKQQGQYALVAFQGYDMEEGFDISKEIERKALDTLAKLFHDHENHKITLAQFRMGIDTLWNVTSGLVGRDFAEVLTYTPNPPKDASYRLSDVLYRGTTIARVTNFMNGRLLVKFRNLTDGKVSEQIHDFSDEVLGEKLAFSKQQEVIETLIQKGFLKI